MALVCSAIVETAYLKVVVDVAADLVVEGVHSLIGTNDQRPLAGSWVEDALRWLVQMVLQV